MSNDYGAAWETLTNAIGAHQGQSSGSIADVDHLSIDQRIKIAEVVALLSIAQEVSALNPQNTKTQDKDGVWRNGWGFPIVD